MVLPGLIKIIEAVEARPLELAKARQDGKKVVGYFCSYIPEEIIYALGLIPLRLEYGGDTNLLEIGSRYISKNNCAFVRETVGLFAEGKDPFVRNSDIVAAATTCFQIYRMTEVLNYFFKVPTTLLLVPRNFYFPEGKEYFQKSVEKFTKHLEIFAGSKLDMGALRESISLFQNIRRTLLEIYKFQSLEHNYINWKDVFTTIQAGFYLDREYYLSLLKELLEELKSIKCVTQESHETHIEKPRILLAGSIIPRGDNKLIDLIEKMGCRIVADDLCTGLRFVSNIEIKDNSLEGIADAYLDKVPCASLPYPFPPETDRRLSFLSYLIDTYKVEGIIYHTLRYCDPFSFKANETKNFFKKKVAFLEIHTEYASSDVGSIMTRVEAFKELIDNLRLSRDRLHMVK